MSAESSRAPSPDAAAEAAADATPSSAADETPPSRTAVGLLVAGAAIGLALAAFGLLEDRREASGLGPDVAAVVGERVIRRVDYERVLAGVESDRRTPVDEALRRRVLDRMIDEELLVQRALDLGLAAVDRRVRGELTSGLIDSIVSEADGDPASPSEVARHYEENIDFFKRPGRLHPQTLFFSTRNDGEDPRGTAAERAARARAALLAGEPVERVQAEWADRQVSSPPAAVLPPSKVRDSLGPRLLEVLMALETGVWSEPVESGGGVHLVRPVDREPAIVPSFEEIEGLVAQDLRRRRGDEALRRYLDALRAETPVAVSEAIFEATGR